MGVPQRTIFLVWGTGSGDAATIKRPRMITGQDLKLQKQSAGGFKRLLVNFHSLRFSYVEPLWVQLILFPSHWESRGPKNWKGFDNL